jgi:putative Mn2+ efflux pump MntP
MVVGASLAFINANILTSAGAIRLSTFVMVILGVTLGRGLDHLAWRRMRIVSIGLPESH